jgi:hypothetical protein
VAQLESGLRMAFNILRTESKSDLAKLRADIEGSIDPTDLIERGFVDDIVYHTWDIMRYQRVANGILDNALRRAFAQILNEILLPPSTAMADESWMSSQRLSHGWLVDPATNRQLASLLKEAGFDESAIEAKAYTLVADDLENANRMLKSARDGRDKALRSIAKYRKSLAVQLRRTSDRVLIADQAPLIAGGKEN